MLLNCGVGEDSWESLGLERDPTSPSSRRSVLGVHWKDWCWSWNSNILATSCEELTHWKRPWCWERLRAGGEGVDRGWDGWMASLTWWTWVWVDSRSWWWTGRPGVLWFVGLQRVGHDRATELNKDPFQTPYFLLEHIHNFWHRLACQMKLEQYQLTTWSLWILSEPHFHWKICGFIHYLCFSGWFLRTSSGRLCTKLPWASYWNWCPLVGSTPQEFSFKNLDWCFDFWHFPQHPT